MNQSDSEIYLSPSDIVVIPCDSKAGGSGARATFNDNHNVIVPPTCSTGNHQISPSATDCRSFPNFNQTVNVFLEAVYHKGTWFAVNRKQLEECQGLERSGKLSEVRIVKLELMDLPEELKLCLLENHQADSNECSELSDDEQFFAKGNRGGYRHLSVKDNFEAVIHDRIEATLASEGPEPQHESQEEEDEDDVDDSSSEGDWSGEDCNSSDDHGCRRICDDGRSASSDEDEECLLKD